MRAAMPRLDRLADALLAVLFRPGRALLSVLGVAVGIGSLVSIVGISQTSETAVSSAFDVIDATTIRVVGASEVEAAVSWESPGAAAALNGVRSAYTLTEIIEGPDDDGPADGRDARRAGAVPYRASVGLWGGGEAELSSGRAFDSGHVARGDKVAVLGAVAAQRLGVNRVSGLPAVVVDREAYTVIGIVGSAPRHPELLNAAVLPDYQDPPGAPPAARVLVVVADVAAVEQVAAQLPVAVAPLAPRSVAVAAPVIPTRVKASVLESVDVMQLGISALTLVVSMFGIASGALVGVLERSGEIGLRRALGASRLTIARQFAVENSLLGAAGGLIGAGAGLGALLAVSLANQWTPVIDGWILVAAPCLGLATALIASIYPSLRAARLDPAAALRSGVR